MPKGEIDLPGIGRLTVVKHGPRNVEFHIALLRPPTDGPDAQKVGTYTLQTVRAELRKVLEHLIWGLGAELECDCTYTPDHRGGVGTLVVPIIPKLGAEGFNFGTKELWEKVEEAVRT